MSTSTLTTVVGTNNNDEKKSTTTLVLPVASGLPNRTALRSRPQTERPARRSRVHRPHGSGQTVPTPLYRWTEPFTWQDGALYDETTLKQQFVTNLQEVPHLLGVLQEDMVDTESLTTPYFQPVLPELTVPLGVNETWYFLEVILWSGAGVSGTNQTLLGWYTPLDALMQGTGPQIDGNGNVYLHQIQLNQTLETQMEWNEVTAIPGHNAGEQRLTWMEFFVTTGTSSGDLECGFTTLTDGISTTIYAGTCLFGMRLAP